VKPPTSESYWVDERLLAGKYPGSTSDHEAREKVEQLLQAGIRTFIDLTEDSELLPYVHLVPPGVSHHRIAVPDVTSPTEEQVRQALDLIESGAEEGLVYLHCRGGCGRTGVVLGCYLVEQGMDADAALGRVHRLTRALWRTNCPETREQVWLVHRWEMISSS
jgi:protein-tyrosine phosphatase